MNEKLNNDWNQGVGLFEKSILYCEDIQMVWQVMTCVSRFCRQLRRGLNYEI